MNHKIVAAIATEKMDAQFLLCVCKTGAKPPTGRAFAAGRARRCEHA